MKRYTVGLDRSAQKDLRAIRDVRLRDTLEREIYRLADDPRLPGCVKLSGFKDKWRVRVGDWRVAYRIEDGRLVVLVVTVRGGMGFEGKRVRELSGSAGLQWEEKSLGAPRRAYECQKPV